MPELYREDYVAIAVAAMQAADAAAVICECQRPEVIAAVASTFVQLAVLDGKHAHGLQTDRPAFRQQQAA